ncbi:MAG: hypothetical protein FWG85_02695 [Bacteroidetes bacterium]|nr:hypothetical protein [Bacteroidota bacterium]
MLNDCCIDFNDFLNEQLQDKEFKKGYEKKKEILKIELQFNEQLRKMGRDDLFVDVKEMTYR